MKSKSELSRLTIDIPKIDHKRLKALAAHEGVSMRDIILESIESRIEKRRKEDEVCKRKHIPNKKTAKAIEEAKKGKDLIIYKDPADYFKKFGK